MATPRGIVEIFGEFYRSSDNGIFGLPELEQVTIRESLSETYALHFELTIFNGVRTDLQLLVKALTQQMTDYNIWEKDELGLFIYAMPFLTSANVYGLYAQVIYPEITVSRRQHEAAHTFLTGRLPNLQVIQDIMEKHPELNVIQRMIGPPRDEVPVPVAMHSVDDGPSARLMPLFCVIIDSYAVRGLSDADPRWSTFRSSGIGIDYDQLTHIQKWAEMGLKRRDWFEPSARQAATCHVLCQCGSCDPLWFQRGWWCPL
jgi:hypothetical protein